jgi:hypothetical protein
MQWKTSNWQILSPHEMSDSHIRNCIKQLKNRIVDPVDVVWPDTFWFSFVESEINNHNSEIEKFIQEFESELKKRL